jgi:hypothetical protein
MPRTLTPAERLQRQQAALKHGLYATTSAARLRQRRLRNKVSRLRRDYPALADKPRHLVARYCEVETLTSSIWNALFEQGPVNNDGEPRRLLSEYRLLLAELRALADTLGITAPVESNPLVDLLGVSRG